MKFVQMLVETSYILSPAHWNRGIMIEVLACIIPFAFERLHLNKVLAKFNEG